MNEFDLINRFFKPQSHTPSVLVGIGDDAALLQVNKDKSIVVTVDSLVEGVHFSSCTPIDAIAQKLVVSNVSDIVASGAIPRWATLSLTLVAVDEAWLGAFSQALHAQLKHYGVALIGGDTTRGKQVHLSMTLLGECQSTQYVSRRGARAGDVICLGGTIGDSALGLKIEQELHKNPDFICQSECKHELRTLLNRFHYPQAQVALGLFLKDYATAMIDISDGFLQDLRHLIEQSEGEDLGFSLSVDEKILSSEYRKVCPWFFKNRGAIFFKGGKISEHMSFCLTSGEEYVLCATVPPQALREIQQTKQLEKIGANLYPVGKITNTEGLMINGETMNFTDKSTLGYQHF